MTRIRREIAAKKFGKLKASMNDALARCDKEEFVQMAWASWGLQQPFTIDEAKRRLRHTPEFVTGDLSSDLAIRPWEWESLINLLLAIPR